ncbi:MAG: cytochrome-c peroxidase [Flavobacteriales bacterium]
MEVPWRQAPEHWPDLPQPEDNELTVARWELGKRMFFDAQFSIDGTVSCASCHVPSNAMGSVTATSPGAGGAAGTRNTPSLANVAYFPYYLREGGVPTLEMQVLVPIQEENEFHHNIVAIAEALAEDSAYTKASLEAYNEEPSPYVVTRALAAFQRGLLDGNSRYDQWLAGDDSALSESALSGMAVFEDVGCGRCHGGHLFTDHRVVNNGLLEVYEDEGLARLTGRQEDVGKFKVPSLRNVGITAPYMFDGSLATLDDVITHYVAGGEAHPNKAVEISPLVLTESQKEDLKAFLEALTDESFVTWCENLVP